MLKNICFVFLAIILLPSLSFGKVKTIYASHKYIMGDNDSKNDARKMCFIEAKRKALEMAGTYIRSNTEIKNLQVTKDELEIYSGALIKVETIKEEWKPVGESLAVFLYVKAKVDTSNIEKNLIEIKRNKALKTKILTLQKQLRGLDQKYLNLKKKLAKADETRALSLRQDRITLFNKIDNIEKKYDLIMKGIHKRRKTNKQKTVEMGKLVLNYIEIGMTLKDVKHILGEPDKYFPVSYDVIYDRYQIGFRRNPDVLFGKEEAVGWIYIMMGNLRSGCKVLIKSESYNIMKDGINFHKTPKFNHHRCTTGLGLSTDLLISKIKEYVQIK